MEEACFEDLPDSPRMGDRSPSRLPGTTVRVEDRVSVLWLTVCRFFELRDLWALDLSPRATGPASASFWVPREALWLEDVFAGFRFSRFLDRLVGAFWRGSGEGAWPPSSVDSVDDHMVARSGERDRCLRRGVCCLGVDLACVRLVTELMEGMGFTGWLEDLNNEDGDGFGG